VGEKPDDSYGKKQLKHLHSKGGGGSEKETRGGTLGEEKQGGGHLYSYAKRKGGRKGGGNLVRHFRGRLHRKPTETERRNLQTQGRRRRN